MSQPTVCAVCQRYKVDGKKALYDFPVCTRCQNGFTNRRHLAYFIDWLLLTPFCVGPLFIILAAVMSAGRPDSTFERTAAIGLLVMVVANVAFLMKDGMRGYSPGKYLAGVRVYQVQTGEPLGPLGSVARNLILTAPMVLVFLIAFQLSKGPRLGDGLAHSKVVWLKYAASPVFAVGAVPATEGDSSRAESTESLPPVDDGNPYAAPRR